MGEAEETETKTEKELIAQSICPVCKAKLKHTEGCLECTVCGWSLCLEA